MPPLRMAQEKRVIQITDQARFFGNLIVNMGNRSPDLAHRMRASQPADFTAATGADVNSSVSPRCVWVLRIVPDASSSTECADKHADSRHGGTLLLSFLIWFLRFK